MLTDDRVRAARVTDAAALAPLFAGLGYPAAAAVIGERIERLGAAGVPMLVLERGSQVVACCTLAIMAVLHRPAPVGRIMLLVVDPAVRGGGIGARLLAAGEAELRHRGCGVIEVPSAVARHAAHRFYEREEYRHTAHRFDKPDRSEA